MKDNNLQVWEKIFQENEWGKYPSIPVIRFIARNFYKVKNRKGIKILEIGSGTGANLWFCAREGFSVIGLEGSKTANERMLKRFDEENLTSHILDTKIGDYFETLDEIEDNSIDAIIDSESLYCNSFDRSKEIVVKSFNKLKVGG
jgi:cyclopropane fatty-acyl-phospholipid synthase-like methyltransferase